MKKFAAIFMSVLLVMSFVAGCSQNSEGSSNKVNSTTVKKPNRDLEKEGLPAFNEEVASLPGTTLEVWLAADYSNQKPIQDAIKDFMSVYPNIQVKTTGITWEDMPNKVKLAVTGGAPPDIAHSHAFAMGAQGLAEPLDDLWKKWGKEKEFLPGAMEDVEWGGKKYGMPLDINTTFYIYNQKMFEEKGIKEPPKKLDELLEVSKKLTNADGSRYGFVTSASGWGMYGHVVAEGGDILRFEGNKVTATFNDPKVVEVVKKYTELSTKHKVSPVPPPQVRQSDNPVAMFGSGRAAAFVSGPWDIARIKNEFPNVYPHLATAKIPGVEKGSVTGGGSLFVPKGSKNKTAAFELMKWFVSDKYAMRMAKEMGRHPVKPHLYEDPFYRDPLLKPFIETLKHAKAFKLEAFPEANDAWGKAIRNAFDGGDAKKALDQAQHRAETALQKALK